MSTVVERRTYDLKNGELLCKDSMEEQKQGFKPFWRHRSFEEPKDIVTVLMFNQDI